MKIVIRTIYHFNSKKIQEFGSDLLKKQIDLNAEFNNIINEDFWELLDNENKKN